MQVKGKGKDMKCDPLFPSMKPVRAVMDVLHLLLRVADCHFNLFVTELVKDLGEKKALPLIEDGMAKIMRGWKFFLRATKGSGNSWEAKHGCSVLRGNDKLTLLRQFSAVVDVTHAHDAVRKAWLTETWTLLSSICDRTAAEPDDNENSEQRKRRAEALQADMEKMVKLVNKPSQGVKGRSDCVRGGCTAVQTSTPHCHFLHCHAHELVAEHGGLRRFNMQGVEHLNNSDGRALASVVSGQKRMVLAELLLRNARMVFHEDKLEISGRSKEVPCKTCEKKFTTKGRLRQHMRTTHRMDASEMEEFKSPSRSLGPHTHTNACTHMHTVCAVRTWHTFSQICFFVLAFFFVIFFLCLRGFRKEAKVREERQGPLEPEESEEEAWLPEDKVDGRAQIRDELAAKAQIVQTIDNTTFAIGTQVNIAHIPVISHIF